MPLLAAIHPLLSHARRLQPAGIRCYALLGSALLILLPSCAPPLEVTQFHLRDGYTQRTGVPMIDTEAHYRYGNTIEAQDRATKHGHYYSVRWKASLLPYPSQPVTVRFSYQQPDQGREPRIQEQTIPASAPRHCAFQITDRDYSQHGRILAWKAELLQNGSPIASQQSFLWQ